MIPNLKRGCACSWSSMTRRLRAELPHSVGLRKLLLGVAHVFANRRQQPVNNVVIAHELMHTLGATDKYDPANNLPIFPQGFAEPDREPLYPQRFAEIMGGRIPISAATRRDSAGSAIDPGGTADGRRNRLGQVGLRCLLDCRP